MGRIITVSDQVYTALQRQAMRDRQSPNFLAEHWLKQHLDLERYPELEWRQGPGGWRVGIRGTALDIYTVVGYVHAGYGLQEIAEDMLPSLSPQQVRAALRYYAEYPDEIDRVLAESAPEAAKARLYRTLGPEGYRRLASSPDMPRIIREAQTQYGDDVESPTEDD